MKESAVPMQMILLTCKRNAWFQDKIPTVITVWLALGISRCDKKPENETKRRP